MKRWSDRMRPARVRPGLPRGTFVLALLVAASFVAPGCGKRRPPLPPVERVPQRTELLSGVQRGNQVVLEWPAPLRNAPDQSVQSIRRVDVYRLAEAVDDPLPLTEEEFSARATLIGSVPFDEISRARDTISYVDQLQLREPVRLRYALRYVNAAGQRASFSNFLLIEPATTVSNPPVLGDAPTVAQNAVTLSWQPPSENVDGSRPPNLLGYNLYRSTGSQTEPGTRPLNSTPLTTNTFADQNFTFGEEYVYVVRAVSLGTGGNPVESLNSNAVRVRPVDAFPPSAPSGITAAGSPGRISIFFAANPERDVIGYDVYRSTDPDSPRDRWIKLNRTPLTRTTYQDSDVQAGTRYYYYLTATDSAGNVSQPSEVVSEITP